jgi:bifunctional non-homologous end joining protein LigD
MSLKEYRKKRRFDVTSEPRGKDVEETAPAADPGGSGAPAAKKPGRKSKAAPAAAPAARPQTLAFVVQKHRATALHYDVRLEWKGVMLSWAVPKGPCYDPTVKRLAMEVEDHPIEYNAFEGIIPAGEYGGGTVMIWDQGTWTPEVPDVEAAKKKGEIKFSLEGQKLRGSWVLVRTRPLGAEGKPAWLMIKHRDRWATTEDIAELAPRSVVTNRLLIEIARDEGGDMRKAADGDPPSQLQEILENPALLVPPKKTRKKSVWHSKKPMS